MKYVSRILFIGGFLFALFAIPLVTLLKTRWNRSLSMSKGLWQLLRHFLVKAYGTAATSTNGRPSCQTTLRCETPC